MLWRPRDSILWRLFRNMPNTLIHSKKRFSVARLEKDIICSLGYNPTRKSYQATAAKLKNLAAICPAGRDLARKALNYYLTTYSNRPALREELSKVHIWTYWALCQPYKQTPHLKSSDIRICLYIIPSKSLNHLIINATTHLQRGRILRRQLPINQQVSTYNSRLERVASWRFKAFYGHATYKILTTLPLLKRIEEE